MKKRLMLIEVKEHLGTSLTKSNALIGCGISGAND